MPNMASHSSDHAAPDTVDMQTVALISCKQQLCAANRMATPGTQTRPSTCCRHISAGLHTMASAAHAVRPGNSVTGAGPVTNADAGGAASPARVQGCSCAGKGVIFMGESIAAAPSWEWLAGEGVLATESDLYFADTACGCGLGDCRDAERLSGEAELLLPLTGLEGRLLWRKCSRPKLLEQCLSCCGFLICAGFG